MDAYVVNTMAQQFLFQYTHNTYRCRQVLPNVFRVHFNTNTDFIYLTGNDRIRYKVELKYSESLDCYYLRVDEWYAFIDANVPAETHTIHFILQGVDDYYVTVYDGEGEECVGYDPVAVGPRNDRCCAEYNPGMILVPGDFVDDDLEDDFTIICDNLTFNSQHQRLQLAADDPLTVIGLTGNGWTDLAMTVGVQVGQGLVLTNLYDNQISVLVIGNDGLGLNREDIRYTFMREFGQRELMYRDRHDKRMQQFCRWPRHADHVDETDVFYASLCAYVSDGHKLTIPGDFCTTHPQMHTYKKAYIAYHDIVHAMKVQRPFDARDPDKTNHVVIYGNWRKLGQDCRFTEPKMMRMKLMEIITENEDGAEVQVPLFHVC